MSEPAAAAPVRPLQLVAALCAVMGAAYGYVGAPPEAGVGIGLTLLPVMVATLWIERDARIRGVGLVFDWGFYGYFAWPLFFPWYSFRTRGRRGWRLTAGLLLCAASSWVGIIVGVVAGLLVRGGV